MSRRVEAALLAAVLSLSLAALAVPVHASPPAGPPLQARTNYTLYGDASTGWGFASSSISKPGPTLYVHAGDNVTLTLYSDDGAPHNWFIDQNRDRQPDGAEPSSPDFSSRTTPLVWSFDVPMNATGVWTYLCRYHVISMFGQIVVLSPQNMTLYGDAGKGWGFTNSTIMEPGPTLYVLQGMNVTLHLIANDTQPHTWFLAYANGTGPAAGEPISDTFRPNEPTNFTFAPDRAGTFTYRCSVHPGQMTGTIVVFGQGAPPPGTPLGIVSAIMIVTIIVVLVLAGVYQVRAVRAARRSK